MGTLADWQIHERCMAGMVTPYDPALLNPASLDLRLGSNIMIESAESPEMVLVSIAKHTEENPYLIVPGQLFLAEADPIFNIPNDLDGGAAKAVATCGTPCSRLKSRSRAGD